MDAIQFMIFGCHHINLWSPLVQQGLTLRDLNHSQIFCDPLDASNLIGLWESYWAQRFETILAKETDDPMES